MENAVTAGSAENLACTLRPYLWSRGCARASPRCSKPASPVQSKDRQYSQKSGRISDEVGWFCPAGNAVADAGLYGAVSGVEGGQSHAGSFIGNDSDFMNGSISTGTTALNRLTKKH